KAATFPPRASAPGGALCGGLVAAVLRPSRAVLGRHPVLLLVPNALDRARRSDPDPGLLRGRARGRRAELNLLATTIFVALFAFVTLLGFVAARWRKGDLTQLTEWGLGGRRF